MNLLLLNLPVLLANKSLDNNTFPSNCNECYEVSETISNSFIQHANTLRMAVEFIFEPNSILDSIFSRNFVSERGMYGFESNKLATYVKDSYFRTIFLANKVILIMYYNIICTRLKAAVKILVWNAFSDTANEIKLTRLNVLILNT